MTEDTRVRETWAYAGIRLDHSGKKHHAWQDRPGNDLMRFAKLVGRTVGAEYDVMVNRDADGKFQTVSVPALFAGSEHDNRELVEQWQTEHRLAEVKLARDRGERKLQKEPDAFELAIQPLRDLRAKSCRTWADRAAFLALVIEALTR
jgi:hypothetical protein